MTLQVEVKPDFHNTVSITDYTLEFPEDGYIPEDVEEVIPRLYNYKYSDTCTIDVIKYISSQSEEITDIYYYPHYEHRDQIRIPLPKDGYYGITHIVLPTVEWYAKVSNSEDLNQYKGIYITDGKLVYKVYNEELVVADIAEVIDRNPIETTISRANFKIFTMDKLRHCYDTVAHRILDSYTGRCSFIDDELRFKRDFLWMTINVIKYHLEWGEYSSAQLVLEGISGCNGLCADIGGPRERRKGGCGCSG